MDAISRKKQIYKVTIVGSVANAILVGLKLLAGIFGGSTAMIADAVHSLSDFITDIIVLLFVKISSKPKDEGHSYGHGKYETMATALIGFVLLAVGLGICWDGLKKIYHVIIGEEIQAPEMIAFWAAIVSIIIKEALYHYTRRTGKLVKSELIVANAWHHRSDAFSSIGTAIGIGGALLLGNKWVILDPIAAVIVSVFIIKVSLQLMAPSMNDLLEKSLPESIQKEIISIISSIPEIKDPHNLRTRRIGNDFAIEIHVRVNPEMKVKESHAITRVVENLLREKYGPNTHVAIHIEPIKELL
jgi:cation diffusion facilitator family transporter